MDYSTIYLLITKTKGGVPLINKLNRLYSDIEIKRHILHERLEIYQDFTHPKIVQLSQELDQILNQISLYKKANEN